MWMLLMSLILKAYQTIKIDQREVVYLLENLNVNKSPDVDGFHPRILKETAQEIGIPLTNLFKLSINTGIIPTSWKLAQITPIYKKGDRSNPRNYRPISITSILCRILEKLIKIQLMNYLTQNEIHN